uniref:Serpentine receptor class gamma n=1 Tax=Strongyloides papillosus TaxID=174720 RepID=A0A0N5B6G5_STREA
MLKQNFIFIIIMHIESLSSFEIFQLLYGVPLFTLHILVAIVYTRGFLKQKKCFQNQFYKLQYVQMILAILCYIQNLFSLKLPQWGFFKDFYLNAPIYSSIDYLLVYIFLTLISVNSFLMALNRLTAIKYPTKFLWRYKRTNTIILLQIVFSIITQIPFIPFEAKYVEDIENHSLYSFYVDETIAIIADVKEFIIISIVTFVTFIMNCITIMSFVTLLVLNINLCFTIFGTSLGMYTLNTFALNNFSFVMDMVTLLETPIFIIISKEIRNEVLLFYFRGCLNFKRKVGDITIP